MLTFFLVLAAILLLGVLLSLGPARDGSSDVVDRDAERFRAELAALATRVGHHR